ncbi:MAG: PD40 domain-containing protein, partial [Deltaproteobacteria bacterium]|nr:PD40 domain-containing protein [Deltaproteobacteria bacterium]
RAPAGEVLFTSFLDDKPDVFVGKKKITTDDRHYRGAAFSPDGSRIAVSADNDGQADIFLLDPATGNIIKNLTDNPADDVSPSWSPDGSKIAFVSNRSGGPQVFVMEADGSGQRRLTMAGTYNSTPDFGKNGLVVFAGMDEYKSDIFTVDLSGNIVRLTQDQGNNKDPTWSPDGRFVAFLSDRDGAWKLFIMTDDGRWQFPLMEHSGAYSTPSWGF